MIKIDSLTNIYNDSENKDSADYESDFEAENEIEKEFQNISTDKEIEKSPAKHITHTASFRSRSSSSTASLQRARSGIISRRISPLKNRNSLLLLEKENLMLKNQLKAINANLDDALEKLKKKIVVRSSSIIRHRSKAEQMSIIEKQLNYYEAESNKLQKRIRKLRNVDYKENLKEEIKEKERILKNYEKQLKVKYEEQKERGAVLIKKEQEIEPKEVTEYNELLIEEKKLKLQFENLEEKMEKDNDYYEHLYNKEADLTNELEVLEKIAKNLFNPLSQQEKIMIDTHLKLQKQLSIIERKLFLSIGQLSCKEKNIEKKLQTNKEKIDEMETKLKNKTELLENINKELYDIMKYATNHSLGCLVDALTNTSSLAEEIEEINEDPFKNKSNDISRISSEVEPIEEIADEEEIKSYRDKIAEELDKIDPLLEKVKEIYEENEDLWDSWKNNEEILIENKLEATFRDEATLQLTENDTESIPTLKLDTNSERNEEVFHINEKKTTERDYSESTKEFKALEEIISKEMQSLQKTDDKEHENDKDLDIAKKSRKNSRSGDAKKPFQKPLFNLRSPHEKEIGDKFIKNNKNSHERKESNGSAEFSQEKQYLNVKDIPENFGGKISPHFVQKILENEEATEKSFRKKKSEKSINEKQILEKDQPIDADYICKSGFKSIWQAKDVDLEPVRIKEKSPDRAGKPLGLNKPKKVEKKTDYYKESNFPKEKWDNMNELVYKEITFGHEMIPPINKENPNFEVTFNHDKTPAFSQQKAISLNKKAPIQKDYIESREELIEKINKSHFSNVHNCEVTGDFPSISYDLNQVKSFSNDILKHQRHHATSKKPKLSSNQNSSFDLSEGNYLL
ncbi:unnamed protein product [Blepharisma stoltei]|uniref:Uncharacterized protein n=1 Tax=Blepharisma stoltei TaxID=1481888 RepID=A0AAU9JWB1_9CILI|nr:unnamed protein product [Blepharisma stoltei]